MRRPIRAVPVHADEDPFVTRIRRYIDLDLADLDGLRSVIEAEQTVGRRRDLVVDGYEYRKLCFVKDGFAARYKVLRNGKRQIVNVLLPGDVIGLPGSFLERAVFSVIAVTDMTLQVCTLEAFVGLCYRRPKFGLVLSWLAVQEAVTSASHIVDIGRRTPVERVGHFLLEIHGRLMQVGRADPAGFDLPFSQEILSDAMGLSVPHLNRTLARLKAEGMIAVSDRHVEFLDIEALRLLSHFQPFTFARIPPPAAPALWQAPAAASRVRSGSG